MKHVKSICFEVLLAFGIWFSALSNVCFATASFIFLALNVKQLAVHPRLQFHCRLGIAIQKSKNARPESITHLFRKNNACKSHFHTSWFCIYARPRTYARIEASPITLYREHLCTEAPFAGRKGDAWSALIAFADAINGTLCNKLILPPDAGNALANYKHALASLCFISTNVDLFHYKTRTFNDA